MEMSHLNILSPQNNRHPHVYRIFTILYPSRRQNRWSQVTLLFVCFGDVEMVRVKEAIEKLTDLLDLGSIEALVTRIVIVRAH